MPGNSCVQSLTCPSHLPTQVPRCFYARWAANGPLRPDTTARAAVGRDRMLCGASGGLFASPNILLEFLVASKGAPSTRSNPPYPQTCSCAHCLRVLSCPLPVKPPAPKGVRGSYLLAVLGERRLDERCLLEGERSAARRRRSPGAREARSTTERRRTSRRGRRRAETWPQPRRPYSA